MKGLRARGTHCRQQYQCGSDCEQHWHEHLPAMTFAQGPASAEAAKRANRDSGDSREVEEVPGKHQAGTLEDAADTEIGRLFHRGMRSGLSASPNSRSVITLCRHASTKVAPCPPSEGSASPS